MKRLVIFLVLLGLFLSMGISTQAQDGDEELFPHCEGPRWDCMLMDRGNYDIETGRVYDQIWTPISSLNTPWPEIPEAVLEVTFEELKYQGYLQSCDEYHGCEEFLIGSERLLVYVNRLRSGYLLEISLAMHGTFLQSDMSELMIVPFKMIHLFYQVEEYMEGRQVKFPLFKDQVGVLLAKLYLDSEEGSQVRLREMAAAKLESSRAEVTFFDETGELSFDEANEWMIQARVMVDEFSRDYPVVMANVDRVALGNYESPKNLGESNRQEKAIELTVGYPYLFTKVVEHELRHLLSPSLIYLGSLEDGKYQLWHPLEYVTLESVLSLYQLMLDHVVFVVENSEVFLESSPFVNHWFSHSGYADQLGFYQQVYDLGVELYGEDAGELEALEEGLLAHSGNFGWILPREIGADRLILSLSREYLSAVDTVADDKAKLVERILQLTLSQGLHDLVDPMLGCAGEWYSFIYVDTCEKQDDIELWGAYARSHNLVESYRVEVMSGGLMSRDEIFSGERDIYLGHWLKIYPQLAKYQPELEQTGFAWSLLNQPADMDQYYLSVAGMFESRMEFDRQVLIYVVRVARESELVDPDLTTNLKQVVAMVSPIPSDLQSYLSSDEMAWFEDWIAMETE